MVKIKTKKLMTLPELIQWGWDNEIENEHYVSNVDEASIYFDKQSFVEIDCEIDKTETFTVEVEDEITEFTDLDNLVEIVENSCGYLKFMKYSFPISIRRCIKNNPDAMTSKAFHILNKDMTMTLIWKDGKLVD
ncbi:hypothetical protein [Staphylococcus simiae]|uniref:Phage protein n=1 Tax=Staphylococcus simiae CCM 7213 = CCUG 51256 TaxID=911238 RepID=G5JH69_9STAP|nr:hypothetical protein [Staphylococcus simiae]EHJ08417.1 hypothetical protein SS7213T_03990 [Staphylococcus simiae CCM 7213 = CCUG 51256]PNZ12625.1 hypothetical protein CD113_06310 [Staphylococcus simiae]SNV67170.1 PVL orf 52-like protein [Staphylococcus simiae]